jgi:hypothetical protein
MPTFPDRSTCDTFLVSEYCCASPRCPFSCVEYHQLQDHYKCNPECEQLQRQRRPAVNLSTNVEHDTFPSIQALLSTAYNEELQERQAFLDVQRAQADNFEARIFTGTDFPCEVAIDAPDIDEAADLDGNSGSSVSFDDGFDYYFPVQEDTDAEERHVLQTLMQYMSHSGSRPVTTATPEFEFLSKLLKIVLQARMPLRYFNDLLDWAREGAVGRGQVLLQRREPKRLCAFTKQLVDQYGIGPRASIPSSFIMLDTEPACTSAAVASAYPDSAGQVIEHTGVVTPVYRFRFRETLLNLLSDVELFGDEDNLVINLTENPNDRFLPYRVTSQTPLDEIPTASRYQHVARLPEFSSGKEFLLPILLYGDSTMVDKVGKYSIEPWIFTLGIIKERVRRTKQDCWRLLGLRSSTSVSKDSGVNLRNGHKCLAALLEDLVDCMRTGIETNLILGQVVKKMIVKPVPFFVIQDGKSRDFITGRFGSSNGVARISVHCLCSMEEADDVDKVCTPITKARVLPLSRICCFRHDAELESYSAFEMVTDVETLEKVYGPFTFADWKGETSPIKLLKDELLNARSSPHSEAFKAVQRECRRILRSISQHESYSPFHTLFPSPSDPFGIFQATPVDMMHAFLLGILKYEVETIINLFPPKSQNVMETYVLKVVGTCKQSAGNRFPRANFVKRFCSLKQVTAEEWDGMAFTLFLYLQTDHGSEALRQELAKKLGDSRPRAATKRLRGVVRTLSELLCFHAWIRHGPFGFAGDVLQPGGTLHSLEKRVLSMLHRILRNVPREKFKKDGSIEPVGNGYKIQKFHDMKWLVTFICRFGSPWNFDAGAGEKLLKVYAKQPGATAQKTSIATMDKQIATRLETYEALQNFDRQFLKAGDILAKEPDLKRCRVTHEESHHPRTRSSDSNGDDDSCKSVESVDHNGEEFEEPVDVKGENKLRGLLWEVEVVDPSIPSKEWNFVDPRKRFVVETVLFDAVKEAVKAEVTRRIQAGGYHTAKVTGYSELKRFLKNSKGVCVSDPVFVRSHNQYTTGSGPEAKNNTWLDWILVEWKEQESDSAGSVQPREVYDPPENLVNLFRLKPANVPNVEFAAESKGLASFAPGIFPARVLSIFVLEAGASTGDYSDFCDCLLVVHACAGDTGQHPDGTNHSRQHPDTSLIGHRWKLEYTSHGDPALRVVLASEVIRTVFVADPYHSYPLCQESDREDPYVFAVFERDEVWPFQFLFSDLFLDT